MKVTYYAAASLDGYIADKDGGVGWLEELNLPGGKDSYEEFFATVDGIVMGRTTYEQIHTFGVWLYGNKPAWVCAHGPVPAVDGCNLMKGATPRAACLAAEQTGVEHLWLVGGGLLAASFVEEELLTHVTVSQMPVVLGRGVPLFGPLTEPVKLVLEHSRDYVGFSQLEYALY